MNDQDVDRMLEQAFPEGQAPAELRQRVLRDSTAALSTRRRRHLGWRAASLAAAAVLIATISFLSGRASVEQRERIVVVSAPADPETVNVPNELVAWLEAARFFKQLGMEERVASAYERAGQLVPQDQPVAADGAIATYAAEKSSSPEESSDEPPTSKRPLILANAFGG